MSPVWQPPWPLQAFWPLQSCLFMDASLTPELAPMLELLELELEFSLLQPVVTIEPATNPAIAAETISVLAVRVIYFVRSLLPDSE